MEDHIPKLAGQEAFVVQVAPGIAWVKSRRGDQY
jgi:hypothetical protein